MIKRSKSGDEKEVLSSNPPDGRAEPVCKEFYEDHIRELLVLPSRTPVFFIPLAENLVETRRRCLVANNLCVFLRDIEWLGDQVQEIASNQHIWIEEERFDLFVQVHEDVVRIYRQSSRNQLTGPEGHRTGP